MSMLCEASGLVRQIAAPATGKAALLRAYRKLGWTYNRVKDVYYGDHRVRISGEEIDTLRVTARREMASNDTPSIRELRAQLAVVVRHLQRSDPTFHHPLVEAICGETHHSSGEEITASRADGD